MKKKGCSSYLLLREYVVAYSMILNIASRSFTGLDGNQQQRKDIHSPDENRGFTCILSRL